MNEEEIQRKRRQNEEEATERRARILGLVYLDTREFENDIPLVTNLGCRLRRLQATRHQGRIHLRSAEQEADGRTGEGHEV